MMIKDWNPLKQSSAIIGYTQCGKTNLAVYLCWLLGLRGYNLKIIDPNEKFQVLNPAFVIHSLDQLRPTGVQIFQTDSWTDKLFDSIFEKCFSFRNQNVVVVADEVHNVEKKYRTTPNFELFTRNCHNRNIGYIYIVQRPQETATMAFSNAVHRFAFKMDYPSDVDLMEKWIGEDYGEYLNAELAPHTGIYKKFGSQGTELFRVRRMYD